VHECALLLDTIHKVMVRSGAHCVHSWFNARKLDGSLRASLYLYNNKEDCEKLLAGLNDILSL
jgi:cysteine desulfurase/selenocysteine lyase